MVCFSLNHSVIVNKLHNDALGESWITVWRSLLPFRVLSRLLTVKLIFSLQASWGASIWDSSININIQTHYSEFHFPEFTSAVADMKNSVADRNNGQPRFFISTTLNLTCAMQRSRYHVAKQKHLRCSKSAFSAALACSSTPTLGLTGVGSGCMLTWPPRRWWASPSFQSTVLDNGFCRPSWNQETMWS